MRPRIYIECTGYTSAGIRYRVTDEEGRVLVERCRNPEFEAARVLAAAGATGAFEVWRRNGAGPAWVLDIAQAAKLTVHETETRRPTIVPWQPGEFGELETDGQEVPGPAFPVLTGARGRRTTPRMGVGKGRKSRPLASEIPKELVAASTRDLRKTGMTERTPLR